MADEAFAAAVDNWLYSRMARVGPRSQAPSTSDTLLKQPPRVSLAMRALFFLISPETQQGQYLTHR
ncbi:hypothetical protein, partial [Salinisphaera sp. T5B8]|uniref:hypothetical protein n=1 Tax=Salinisphaera sp. T5B8 TaxID=1304154 RepID=UPI003342A50E